MYEGIEFERGKQLAHDYVQNFLDFRKALLAGDERAADLQLEKRKALLEGLYPEDSVVEGMVWGLITALGGFVETLVEVGVPQSKIEASLRAAMMVRHDGGP